LSLTFKNITTYLNFTLCLFIFILTLKMKTSTKQHIIYGIILLVITSTLTTLLIYSNNNLNLQINNLNNNITILQNNLDTKQTQLDSLTTQFRELTFELQGVDDKYNTKFGELTQKVSDINVETGSFTEIISDVINSVVSVGTNKGQGSGVIISSEGHVVTNYHVIEGARTGSVLTYDGKLYGVQIIGYDIKEDLAVLKIVSNQTFNSLEFSNSDNLKAGQKVVALGNPAGLSFTATEGIISSPAREIEGNTFIQTDVTINPGNSGGALIDSQGKIVGIVNFKISGYEELGFAIPSNRVKDVVEEILEE